MVLPCLVSSGVGALLFTGLGQWTGLGIGVLAIPHLTPARLQVAEVAWALPLAAVIAALSWAVFFLGRRTARLVASHLMAATVGAGLAVGAAACAYALLTGHSPAEVALSGQRTLPVPATDPGAWSTGALVALVLFKAVAYGVSLGAFRGGATFPAILIGAACGVLASTLAPGLTLLPGLAIGMAAGAAVLGLPVTSVVLVVLLLGDAASQPDAGGDPGCRCSHGRRGEALQLGFRQPLTPARITDPVIDRAEASRRTGSRQDLGLGRVVLGRGEDSAVAKLGQALHFAATFVEGVVPTYSRILACCSRAAWWLRSFIESPRAKM